jgi:chaperone required for assembly of F1-ATPase
MSRKYVILNTGDTVDFSKILERESDSLRYNIEETKFLVKFEGDTPSFLEGKTIYSHSEILAILATDEWSSDEPI